MKADNFMNRLKVIRTLQCFLAFVDIFVGITFLLGIIIIQGAWFISLLGFMYIILGVAILFRKALIKFILYFGLPLNILSSYTLIMMAISKNVPEYYKISFNTMFVILLILWSIFFFNFFIIKSIKR